MSILFRLFALAALALMVIAEVRLFQTGDPWWLGAFFAAYYMAAGTFAYVFTREVIQ